MKRYEALVILILILHLIGFTVVSFRNAMSVCVAVTVEEASNN